MGGVLEEKYAQKKRKNKFATEVNTTKLELFGCCFGHRHCIGGCSSWR